MFFPGSPLNYPTNKVSPLQRYQADRAPTQFDLANFDLGDEWLDRTNDQWYKLVSKANKIALWCAICNSLTQAVEFLPDSGTTPVLPDGLGQVTITGGAAPRDIEVVGSPNTLTYQLSSAIIGDRCFTCPAPSTAHFCWDCTDACTEFRGIPIGFTDTDFITCQAGVQTGDATPTSIALIALDDLRSMTVKATVTGARADHSASLAGSLVYGARRAGGGATELSPAIVNIMHDGGGTVDINGGVSANDVSLLVTGEAGTTWNWVTTYHYQILNTNI